MDMVTIFNQNRENFRLALDRERKPIICQIKIHKTKVNTRILDISTSGINVVGNTSDFQLALNRVYPSCHLHLSNHTVLSVTLYTHYADELQLQDGQWVKRYGCRFMHCLPATERKIIAFIRERERLFLSNRVR